MFWESARVTTTQPETRRTMLAWLDRAGIHRQRSRPDPLSATMMAISDKNLDRVPVVGGGSVNTAVQNALLACRADGLGCTLTTLHCIREPEVKAVHDIPTNGPHWHSSPSPTRRARATAPSPASPRPPWPSTTPSEHPGARSTILGIQPQELARTASVVRARLNRLGSSMGRPMSMIPTGGSPGGVAGTLIEHESRKLPTEVLRRHNRLVRL